MIQELGQKYNMFVANVENQYGVVPAFAVKTGMTGLIYGVVVAALGVSSKAFASICARAGFTGLASRMAVPVLLTNPWFVLAVSIGIPTLTLLFQALKTKKPEEKKPILNELETKVCQAVGSKIKKSLDCFLGDIGIATLTDQNKKNILEVLHTKYPDQIFGLCQIKDGLVCLWAKKDLNIEELTLMEKIDKRIGISKNSEFYDVDEKGFDIDISAILTHLQLKYPGLTFSDMGCGYDVGSKKTTGKISWSKKV